MTKTTTKKKQKLGLTTIIFLALILGVLFGRFDSLHQS